MLPLSALGRLSRLYRALFPLGASHLRIPGNHTIWCLSLGTLSGNWPMAALLSAMDYFCTAQPQGGGDE